ncbi:MAG: TetR/AcrR family transcriptional regulator [Bradymonadaceae bacterium]
MSDVDSPKEKSAHRQKQRRIILEALAEVVHRDGVHSFSMQQVADEAGLSHRTLYRYFPTREDLLEGLVTYYEEYVVQTEANRQPERLDEIIPHMETLFARFEHYPNECSVGALGSLIMGKQFTVRAHRDHKIFEMVESEISSDADVSSREGGAIVRYLANSLSWLVLRQQLGLNEDETVRAVQWALKTLVAELKKNEPPTED